MEVETRDWRHFRGQHSVATVMGGRLRHGPSDWPTPPGAISVHDAERGESAKGAGVSGAAGRHGWRSSPGNRSKYPSGTAAEAGPRAVLMVSVSHT